MADKYLETGPDGHPQDREPITQSTGAADAGKVGALGVDGKYHSSMMPAGSGYDVFVLPSAEAIPAGSLVNIFTEGGVAKIRRADASDPAKFAHGFILTANTTAGNNSTVYFEGINNQFSGLTAGAKYFLSATTPGGVATTFPAAGSGGIVQEIGVAVSTTEIKFERHPHIKRTS